jgi:predicted MFS family arabinose efflux permease
MPTTDARAQTIPPLQGSAQDAHAARGFIGVMAVAACISVANLYYNQPLLSQMARTFKVGARGVGLIPTFSQSGYAAGMLLLVPLGDILRRKRLIPALLVLVSIALAAAGCARSLSWLVIASFAIGLTTVVPQILIPFAAQLVPAKDRGRAVGTVMMGLLLGILLSRTVSGFVCGRYGWRVMYWIPSGLMVLLAAVLGPFLPGHEPPSKLSYPRLLRSVWGLARRESVLREAMVNGALLFGSFSAFWATLVFRLETAPLHYGEKTAGLFGLVGAAGALVAPAAGRLADRVTSRSILTVASVLMIASFVIFWATGSTLWGLAAGVLLLDVAAQGGIVANQARIYKLSSDSHSRVNSAFMVAYFSGGAAGSLLGAWAWSVAKWGGVCALGTLLPAVALLLHLAAGRRKDQGRTPFVSSN